MKARLFPRRLVGVITAFFLLPINNVYADTYSDDSTYWRWWYVEQITDEMTDGNGVDAENINDTYNGSTVGEYVYNSTGLTADDVKEYVKNQYDNAVGYVDKSAEQYANMIDDIWNSSVDVATKATYQAQKALRETVDTAGNTVVNVSSSSYWGNVYNDLFNNGAYNDQYTQGESNGNSFNTNGVNCSISYVGYGRLSGNVITELNSYTNAECYSSYEPNVTYPYQFICSISCNGYSGYFAVATIQRNPWYDDICYCRPLGFINNTNDYYFNYQYQSAAGLFNKDASIMIYGTITEITDNSTPILQPKQVGYVMHNGIKYPVYSDPSLNPFTVNDDGTVTWNDGTGTEPIFVDPSQLTDDGWLNILENVDNSDSTENPYNPFGRPWNTQDDGSALGGFFGNLVKDIGSVFKGLADTLSRLFNGLVNGILNVLKSLFDIDFNSITTVHLDVNFNFITQIWQKLLQILGVS